MNLGRTGLALLFGLAYLGAARDARAELRTILAGRATGVVAAGDGVAVLREGEVALLDADGRLVGGCRGEGATAGGPARPDGTALSAEEVLGEAGFSDEDESIEAEDVLDDEGHRAAVAPAPRRRDLRRSARPVARGDARRGVDRDGRRPVAPRRPRPRVRARRPRWPGARARRGRGRDRRRAHRRDGLALARRRRVVRGRGRASSRAAHALALAPDGETALVADDDGVVALDAARGLHRVLAGRVDALATCGADVVALAEDTVVRIGDAGTTSVVGPRPPVRALACATADGSGLVAAGVGVWSTADGTRWREEPVGLGRSFSAVASAAGRAWLAGDDALFALAPPAEADTPLKVDDAPPPRLALERQPPAWAGLLPRVAVSFDGWTESTGVAGWRLWVLLTVSLGRRWQRNVTQNPEDVR